MTRPRASTSASRRSSRPGLRLRAAALLAALAAGPLAAQEGPGYSLGAPVETAPQILTLDQEKVFIQSAFGRRVGEEIERRSQALAAENRRLEAGLEAEEKALTEARPTLSAEEFRARADAFDARVQTIRTEQDAKARALGTFRDEEQQRFLQALGPVLAGLVRDSGAVAVLDRRVLVIAVDSIDITDEAVAAMDAALGDGAAGAPQAPDAAPPEEEPPKE